MTSTTHDPRAKFLGHLDDDDGLMVPADVSIEPVEYRTITSVECLNGDPNLPFEVEYPVFDPSQFPRRVRDLIPDPDFFYVDHDNLLFSIISDLLAGMTPMLWGEAGIGKSVGYERVAAMMQVPFQRWHLTEYSDPDMFRGHYELAAGETRWSLSPFVELLGLPSVQVVEEWNSASEGVRFVLRPLMDGYNRLTLDEHQGETYMRSSLAFLAATGNPHWSSRNSGVVPLSEPDNDRMSHHSIGWPKPEVEFDICWNLKTRKGLTVTGPQIVNAIGVWGAMRARIDAGEITAGGSTRSLLRFIEALAVATPKSAFSRCFRRVADDEYRDLVVSLTPADLNMTCKPNTETFALLRPDQQSLCKPSRRRTGVTYTLAEIAKED